MEEIREIKNIIYELGKDADGKLISDLVIEIEKLRSDHKAVVETINKDHARSLWIKDDVIGDLRAIIEEKKKVIMLLKAENYDLAKGIK